MTKTPSIKRRDLTPASIENIEILKAVYPLTIISGAAAIRYALMVAVAQAEKSYPDKVILARRNYRRSLSE